MVDHGYCYCCLPGAVHLHCRGAGREKREKGEMVWYTAYGVEAKKRKQPPDASGYGLSALGTDLDTAFWLMSPLLVDNPTPH